MFVALERRNRTRGRRTRIPFLSPRLVHSVSGTSKRDSTACPSSAMWLSVALPFRLTLHLFFLSSVCARIVLFLGCEGKRIELTCHFKIAEQSQIKNNFWANQFFVMKLTMIWSRNPYIYKFFEKYSSCLNELQFSIELIEHNAWLRCSVGGNLNKNGAVVPFWYHRITLPKCCWLSVTDV